MSGDRINIFPSRGAQTLMKGNVLLVLISIFIPPPPGRLKGATTGHRLLKKKADALQLKFRSILKKIIETKQLMGELMKEASFSLAEAKFASTGDLNQVRSFKNVTYQPKHGNCSGCTSKCEQGPDQGEDQE